MGKHLLELKYLCKLALIFYLAAKPSHRLFTKHKLEEEGSQLKK
jgi:hypothetical protein